MGQISRRNSPAFNFLIFVLILLVCILVGQTFKVDFEYFKSKLNSYPLFLSGLIYCSLYVVLTLFIWFGPKDVFRLLGAVLFGASISTVLVWLSEMINAFILFNLSRKLGREFVARKFSVELRDLDQIKETNMWGVFALRINLIFPFRLLDLGYGLTRISFRNYFWAVIFASPFRIFLVQSILAVVGLGIFNNPLTVAQEILKQPVILIYTVFYVFLVLILSIVAWNVRAVLRSKPRVS